MDYGRGASWGSYQTIGKDLTRVMNRLKAVYRGWGIPCAGTRVYAARYREEWLSKLPQAGVRRRAELLYQQLDGLQALRREVRPEFLAESRKHKAAKCCARDGKLLFSRPSWDRRVREPGSGANKAIAIRIKELSQYDQTA
jgi:hypothetical protein